MEKKIKDRFREINERLLVLEKSIGERIIKRVLKIVDRFNKQIKTFSKFKEGRYSMITTRTCNWDMYIKDLKEEIRDCSKGDKKDG